MGLSEKNLQLAPLTFLKSPQARLYHKGTSIPQPKGLKFINSEWIQDLNSFFVSIELQKCQNWRELRKTEFGLPGGEDDSAGGGVLLLVPGLVTVTEGRND